MELGSDSNIEDEIEYVYENDEESNNEELGSVAAEEVRYYMSVSARELTLADVQGLAYYWVQVAQCETYGEFEWSSLCLDYRQYLGFNHGMFEPGRPPDLTAFMGSGEWT